VTKIQKSVAHAHRPGCVNLPTCRRVEFFPFRTTIESRRQHEHPGLVNLPVKNLDKSMTFFISLVNDKET